MDRLHSYVPDQLLNKAKPQWMIDEFFKFHVEIDYVIRSKQVLDGRYKSYLRTLWKTRHGDIGYTHNGESYVVVTKLYIVLVDERISGILPHVGRTLNGITYPLFSIYIRSKQTMSLIDT